MDGMRPKVDFDVIIIGGGIVGLATAYKLSLRYPQILIAILEKEQTLASHQTGHNSGVIHSGIYYKPGSAKAKTCVQGRRELVEFAQQHGVPFEICGKVIVATRQRELDRLEKILRNGIKNGVEGIQKIGPDQILEIEPECRGIAGIHIPCTGIIDFIRIAQVLADLIQSQHEGNRVMTGQEVTALDRHDFYTKVITRQGAFTTRHFINCAGLHSDHVAAMDGMDARMRIIPFRGDYYELSPEGAQKVRGLVYPVPDPAFPFLGVHFTRKLNGSVECGPNAVFSFKREGYTRTAFDWKDTQESLAFAGTWKLFMRNWRYGLGEYARAFSKKLFLRQLQRLIPTLDLADIKPGGAGVRAQAVGRNGRPIDDFVIEQGHHSLHVLNAPSPAATACLAIGEHIQNLASRHFGL
jgi:L-2-hydroxyglutarate oxidase